MRDPRQQLAEQRIAELHATAAMSRLAATHRAHRRSAIRVAVGRQLVRLGERLAAPRAETCVVSS